MAHHLFDADIARYKAAGLQAAYVWWPDEMDAEFEELLKAKKQNPGSQIRAYRGLREDGRATLWFCLFGMDGAYITGFNNSWPCPPFCS